MSSRPSYIRALRQLSRESPQDFDTDAIRRELRSDSDRAMIVLLSTYVEDALSTCLRAILDPDLHGALFDAEKPLSRFSAKIDAAHSLRLIGRETAKDLHLLREMRNAAAHAKGSVTFADGPLREAVMHFRDVQGWLGRDGPSGASLRDAFVIECSKTEDALAIRARELSRVWKPPRLSSVLP